VVGLLVCIAGLLAGCGPREVRGVKFKGQLLKDGQPVAPQRDEQTVMVLFERLEPPGPPNIRTGGQLQKDGTFTVEGQVAKGTPPGKYAVWISAEMRGDAESRFAPLFTSGTSPFIADVTEEDNQHFVIDIGKKTVTKQ
jgi:hypothetical protein